ncbi:DUF6894 family protein [Brevundimonas sp. DWR2-3-1b1]|uniref:DUF6894 family protein n=1 Tax=unclassified Brevundimonas TaxID=2622653 RepID=UPI003CF26AAB
MPRPTQEPPPAADHSPSPGRRRTRSAGSPGRPPRSSRAPRYFFNTADGSCVRDPQGDVLPALNEAKQMALAVMGELLRMQPPTLLVDGEFTLSVTDEAGSLLWLVRSSTGRP